MNVQANRTSAPAQSLAATLALALVSLSLLVILLSNVPQLWTNLQSQQTALVSRQRFIGQNAARTVHDFMEQRLANLAAASRLTNLAAQTPEGQTELLQRLLGLEPSFLYLKVLDTQGQKLAQASRLSLASNHDLDADLLSNLLRQTRQGNQYISPVFIDPITSEPEVLVAVPVFDVFGTTHGALTALVNLKFMWDLVDQIDVGEGGLAYVVDRQGKLLAFKDTARVLRGENLASIVAVHEFMTAPQAPETMRLLHYTGVLGSDVVGGYVALEIPDWAVVTEVPLAVAYRGIINNVVLALGIMLSAVILAGLVGRQIAQRLTSSLVDLMNTADRIAAGERELQVAIGGPREVATLAQAFNTMTAQLRLTLAGLEERVAQRTAALQAALSEVETQAREQARLLAENEQQRLAIREASVPVLPVTAEMLVMPLIGAIDTQRLAHIQEYALQALERTHARYLLLDITGVPVVDSQVAQGLITVAQMTRLLGAEVILIGVRPEVAQTIVGLGLDLRSLRTAADLQTVLHKLTYSRHG